MPIPDSVPIPDSTVDLPALLGRYRLGQAAYDELVPPLTEELVKAQRVGSPLAVTVVRDFADSLYAATDNALGTRNAERSPRHSILAPAGRITSDEDADRPAVMLLSAYGMGLPFNQFTMVEGVHPYIHVTAAARALSVLGSVFEAGGPVRLSGALDRVWFLLAFSLNTNLWPGEMLDPDRDLIVDLIGACARLHQLSDAVEPPAFVRDAIDRDLALRHFASEWITTDRYATTDGKVINEGHNELWDSELRLPVGTLLREQFGGPNTVPGDPAAALALGRQKAESGDFTGARAAVESVLTHPELGHQAKDLLRELVAEQACRELILILAQYSAESGSPGRQRVVEIGQELHDLGGMALMQAVHTEFTSRRRPLSRNLDLIWNGIGDWRG